MPDSRVKPGGSRMAVRLAASLLFAAAQAALAVEPELSAVGAAVATGSDLLETSIVAEKLELVGLDGLESRYPSELSGGMKKRVGLARALVSNPNYILYDEPTTGLDPIMSDSIDNLIMDLGTKLNVTSVVVTHDMYSVKNVADNVAMIHDGKMYFVGKPQDLLTSDDPVIIDFIKRTGV